MGTFYDAITEEQADLVRRTPLFFIASCAPDCAPGANGQGAVNVSPKGGVPLHILDASTVAYLDYPGSGNETARHALAGGPVTVMICSFDDDAAIVRFYGTARIHPADAPIFARMGAERADALGNPRQVVEIAVTRTQTSCGYGVPLLENPRSRRKDQRGRRYKPARRAV